MILCIIVVALVIVSEVAEHANQSMKYGVSMHFLPHLYAKYHSYWVT